MCYEELALRLIFSDLKDLSFHKSITILQVANGSLATTKLAGKTISVSCNNPVSLLKAMHQSEFCLQPPGDSPTRRSFFDAMLAGCIPVIFSKEAAWSQYVNHLPEKGESYSIFIPVCKHSPISLLSFLAQNYYFLSD